MSDPKVLYAWETDGWRYRLAARADRNGLRPEVFYGGSWIASWQDPAVVAEIARLAERVRELEALKGAERAEEVQSAALFLFGLLDDIDTLDDACKASDAAFRSSARRIQRRRFEVADTDGYRVWIKGQLPTVASPALSEEKKP